ncbi:hypothetical protein PROFUN_00886 [Planoprotostelium fungivorum]|uniref:Carboxylic ester hydrolase n=1 Tax=Planoprotostelium fungivorum TaxID=1890364 RepID=A0A2P6P090_9EUKA|nr:hypothetical protein PROFUN_00886 [Planoprotostelium fungivorum]
MEVITTSGPVRGFIDTHPLSKDSTVHLPPGSQKPIKKWLGIPYAKCQRWTYPEEPEHWEEARECYDFGPIPPQNVSGLETIWDKSGIITRRYPQSDTECLNLNVFCPSQASAIHSLPSSSLHRLTFTSQEGKKLPVMVWIYGGSFRDGNSAQTGIYDPTDLLRHFPDVIVVTGNYRVNVLGFICHDDLRELNAERQTGNYGIADQQMMLRWVKNNIERFGGDVDNITLFGESAGAVSVAIHMTLEKSSGFKRAILQSGTADTIPPGDNSHVWGELVRYCGIDESLPPLQKIEAMRKIPNSKLMEAVENNTHWKYVPSLGHIIPLSPAKQISAGYINSDITNVILGCNTDEGSLFGRGYIVDLTDPVKYATLLNTIPGIAREHVRQAYPGLPGDKTTPEGEKAAYKAEADLISDVMFIGPAIAAARNNATVRLYHFDHLCGWLKQSIEDVNRPHLGIMHASEIASVFLHTPCFDESRDAQGKDWKISYDMAKRWIQFAVNGEPQAWPIYNGRGGKVMTFRESKGEVEGDQMFETANALDEEEEREVNMQLWHDIYNAKNGRLTDQLYFAAKMLSLTYLPSWITGKK